jgi:Domain of unknown function (DUF6378)
MTNPTGREYILNEAMKCVTVDRNNTYGTPEDNFQMIANLWNVMFEKRRGQFTFTSFDVAMAFVQVKVARTTTSPEKADNLIDGAGYFACAYDCVKPTDKI